MTNRIVAVVFLSSLLGACQQNGELKPVEYWVNHPREADEMAQGCIMSGGKDINCENVGIAGAKRAENADNAHMRALQKARDQ